MSEHRTPEEIKGEMARRARQALDGVADILDGADGHAFESTALRLARAQALATSAQALAMLAVLPSDVLLASDPVAS